jgi:thiol-disulfide isomerase/thioredoxin
MRYLILFFSNVIAFFLLGYFGWAVQGSVIYIWYTVYAAFFSNTNDNFLKVSLCFLPWLICHTILLIDNAYHMSYILISFSIIYFFIIRFISLKYRLNTKYRIIILTLLIPIFYVCNIRYISLVSLYLKNINVNKELLVNETYLGISDQLVLQKDKYYIFDCWNSSCKACFKKMPEFEKLQSQFNDTNIVFYTFNVPINEDNNSKVKNLLAKHYSLKNNLFSTNINALKGINTDNAYPFLFILHNNKIVNTFEGSLDYISNPLNISIEEKIKDCTSENN